MLINFYGGSCSGKTTTAYSVCAALKMQNLKVGIANETAFDMIISGRSHMLNDQLWMFAEQHRRIEALLKENYIVITDCPLLLSIVYAQPGMPGYEYFLNLIKSTYYAHNNIDIFIERPEVFQVWGRIHTLEQSLKIDQEVRDVLADVGSSYYRVQANEHTTQKVVDIVNELMKPVVSDK